MAGATKTLSFLESETIGITELTALVDRGRVTPLVAGVDVTPPLARLLADPSTHADAVDRITEAVLDRFAYLTGQDLSSEEVRAEVEKGIRARFGRPGQVALMVGALEPRPLRPKPSISF